MYTKLYHKKRDKPNKKLKLFTVCGKTFNNYEKRKEIICEKRKKSINFKKNKKKNNKFLTVKNIIRKAIEYFFTHNSQLWKTLLSEIVKKYKFLWKNS